ncbi:MAG: proprotein convertase P-domain-containing protein [Flavobacteriaceae bacterium]|nr:proprotein convertase P-domain-containing protein [Flavobacteriaceae bacterium]
MKLSYFKIIGLCVFNVFSLTVLTAQESVNVWHKIESSERESSSENAEKRDVYAFNSKVFATFLKKPIPKREMLKVSGVIISFPDGSGSLDSYRIKEASIMHPDLQAQFPQIRSFIGESTSKKGNSIRFSHSSLGIHAMIFRDGKSVELINPLAQLNYYEVVSKKNSKDTNDFQCLVEENLSVAPSKELIESGVKSVSDGLLRTFKLALACTQEYSNFHLTNQSIASNETDIVKKTAVLAAINKTMTRVNGIFERDLSVTMQLVSNQLDLIFLKEDDGFTNDDVTSLINESQTIINNVIGFSNYDIGHTFSTSEGGLAELKSTCTVYKAKGVTGSLNPISDSFDVDYVTHEMGHQFGASHTFNGDAPNCDNGNRAYATAVEPGSGTTIMSYAGICSPINVQMNVDAYFHAVSIAQIYANITGSSSCASVGGTNNSAPVVEAGKSYVIPVGTPFVLAAVASDADQDPLTYVWDQIDTGLVVEFPTPSSTVTGPLFRSFPPTINSKRYFPKLETVVTGALSSTWEVLPSVSREMNFGVLVRDNNLNGGQTAYDTTKISVTDTAGPFIMTSQTQAETWQEGEVKTITWNVANTTGNLINCLEVTILLSTDGGFTFPITLAQNVPNNGSYDIIVPKETSFKGRIKVKASNSIFYTMNTAAISIQASEFVLEFIKKEQNVCEGASVDYNFTYKAFSSFNETTTFSTEKLPTGMTAVFSPSKATTSNTPVVMTISGASEASLGSHDIQVVGTAATTSKKTKVVLNVYSSVLNTPILTSPSDTSFGLIDPVMSTWQSDTNVTSYEYQLSMDTNFTEVYYTEIVSATMVTNPALAYNTAYFWRVKAINKCGKSDFSSIYSFTTADIKCATTEYMGVDIDIPDKNSTGISSVIVVEDQFEITDVNVTISISHSYTGDLSVSLVGPNNVPIELVSNVGANGIGFELTVFDDEQEKGITEGFSPYTGSFRPLKPLSEFDGLISSGEWTLKVIDAVSGDIGKLTDWKLDICGLALDDADGDGVQDEIDDCPNTPPGVGVNASGCPFDLPVNNFRVLAKGETCAGKGNGMLSITTVETHNYALTIAGSTINFTDTIEVVNLAPGDYQYCISIPDEGGYEQCFSVRIESGGSLSGKAVLSKKTSVVTVEVYSGTPPFSIYINEAFVKESFESEILVFVKQGDIVTVKSSIACEGEFSQEFEVFNPTTVYPNPTFDIANVNLYEHLLTRVTATIYNAQMQLVAVQDCQVREGNIAVNLAGFPSGVYIVTIASTKSVSFKLLKK